MRERTLRKNCQCKQYENRAIFNHFNTHNHEQLVAQGCSAGDIKVAYPNRSDREIEEAVAYAQHASIVLA